MSRVQSPDASFQLDEGTALQRLQNGLELGLSINKPTAASARSAEILDAIDQMELKKVPDADERRSRRSRGNIDQ